MPTVLLIDDSAVQARSREAILRSAGFDAHVATTVESALALLKAPALASRFSAIVTDHVMPGASGAEFVRELRRLHSTIPVIVVSGAAEAESDYAGLNVVFRQKPCPPQELIALVRAATG